MALYHYVHSREDLLDGIVELIVDDLYGDPDVHVTPPTGRNTCSVSRTAFAGSRWRTRKSSP